VCKVAILAVMKIRCFDCEIPFFKLLPTLPLGKQRVKENVCSEYTPEEIAEFKGEMKKACSSLAGLKDKYSGKLAEAQWGWTS
jgi:hypothetical protein